MLTLNLSGCRRSRLSHLLLSHLQTFLQFQTPPPTTTPSFPSKPSMPSSFSTHRIPKSLPNSKIHTNKPSISANKSLDFDKSTVLQSLSCYSNDHKRALEFFHWVEAESEFKHTTETYNRMIDILGKFFEFDLAWHLIEKMQNSSNVHSLPNHTTFRVMFKRYVSAHLVKEAIFTYHKLEEFSLKDEISFSNRIDALCEYKHVIEAEELCLVKNKKNDDEKLYFDVYMDIQCKSGEPWKAVKLYKDMKKNGIKMDVVAYNTVIRAVGLCDGVDVAVRLYREMMELVVEPNVVTFNIILKFLCENGRIREAYKMLDKMTSGGCLPDVITYHCLFGCLEKPREILELFDWMFESGVRPKMDTLHTYVLLMRKFGRWGFLRPVFVIWKKIEEHGLIPDEFTYNALIDALLQKGMIDMARKYDRGDVSKRAFG